MTLIDELRELHRELLAHDRWKARSAIVYQAIRALEAAESRPLATWLRIGKHMIAERPDGEVYVLESEVEEMARTMMRLSNERDALKAQRDSLTEQLGLARKKYKIAYSACEDMDTVFNGNPLRYLEAAIASQEIASNALFAIEEIEDAALASQAVPR